MANLSSGYVSNKGLRKNNEWNQTFAKSSENSSGRLPMNNIIPLTSENDGLLNKPPQNSITLKSNSFNGKKCQVYVHHFNKIPSKSSSNYIENNWRSGSEIHQNLYKHEFSEFYDSKMRSLRKQFDNLSLQSSKKPQPYNSLKFPKGYNKFPGQDHMGKASYAKSINGKIDKSILFKPEHKAIVDKLEESYWAKWKPNNKHPPSKEVQLKRKGLYTENEKVKIHYQNTNNKHRRKEMGDSSNSRAEKDETPTDNKLIYIDTSEQNALPEEEEEEEEEKVKQEEVQEEEPENSANEEYLSENVQESITKEISMLSGTSCVLAPVTEVDSDTSILKHTDSFILTSKKQNQEKSPYQQPKCIKLFKNADYTTTAQTNYIKSGTRGGSYPLKSCLKKENSQKPNRLGRPGSPIKMTTRRLGKGNRFIK